MRHNLHFSLRPSLDEKYPPASFGRLDVRTVFSLLLRALSFIPKDRDYRPNRPNRPKPCNIKAFSEKRRRMSLLLSSRNPAVATVQTVRNRPKPSETDVGMYRKPSVLAAISRVSSRNSLDEPFPSTASSSSSRNIGIWCYRFQHVPVSKRSATQTATAHRKHHEGSPAALHRPRARGGRRRHRWEGVDARDRPAGTHSRMGGLLVLQSVWVPAVAFVHSRRRDRMSRMSWADLRLQDHSQHG